jgi:hypothetical protein
MLARFPYFLSRSLKASTDQMIADGEMLEADRSRCVHWTVAHIVGRHEPALAGLT